MNTIQPTKKVVIYTMNHCPHCVSAKNLFKSKSIPFEEILLKEEDDAAWDRLEKETGYKTMPQIFIGEKFIGGYSQLASLNASGELDELLK